MHGTQSATTPPGAKLTYYVCPTRTGKPEDKAKWPGHVRASIREDVLTAKLSEFLDQYALGYDRAARLAELIPASQAQQDDMDDTRAQALDRKLRQADTALTAIAAEIGGAGKTTRSAPPSATASPSSSATATTTRPPSKPNSRPSKTPHPSPPVI